MATIKLAAEIHKTPSDPDFMPSSFKLERCPICEFWYVRNEEIRKGGEEHGCCSFDCPVCTIDNLNVWIGTLAGGQ